MAEIRCRDIKPELVIRKGLHARGLRFRLHSAHLPGRPDVVLARYNTAVFAKGCFWHGHDCALFHWPKTREAFWRQKICANRAPDRRNHEDLRALG